MPFDVSAETLPGVSEPSSVVRSIIRTARSSAKSFASRLIDRFASVAARSSTRDRVDRADARQPRLERELESRCQNRRLGHTRSLAPPQHLAVERVLPALLPVERRRDELLERGAGEQMLERPPIRRMRDHEDPRAVELVQEIAQKRSASARRRRGSSRRRDTARRSGVGLMASISATGCPLSSP